MFFFFVLAAIDDVDCYYCSCCFKYFSFASDTKLKQLYASETRQCVVVAGLYYI